MSEEKRAVIEAEIEEIKAQRECCYEAWLTGDLDLHTMIETLDAGHYREEELRAELAQ